MRVCVGENSGAFGLGGGRAHNVLEKIAYENRKVIGGGRREAVSP